MKAPSNQDDKEGSQKSETRAPSDQQDSERPFVQFEITRLWVFSPVSLKQIKKMVANAFTRSPPASATEVTSVGLRRS